MDKSIKTEIAKAEITRSKLSLTKETLRQLKVRTGPEGWHCFAYGRLRVAARGGGGRSICAHSSVFGSFLTGRAESQGWSDTSPQCRR